MVEIGAAGAARPIARDPALGALAPQAAACAPDGTLWIVGARSSGGATALALATVQNRRLIPAEELGTGAARATLLVADGHGGLLVGLEAGAVRFRGADGAWHDGAVGDALPSGPGRRDAGPARLR